MSGDEPEPPWRMLGSTLAYDGSPWLRVYRDSLETGRGRRVDDFHRIKAKDFVLVFAQTPEDRVVMLRQWRQGPRRFALCFPGGHVEPDEDPAEAAVRELAEEAGYRADRVRPLGRFCMHSNLGIGWGNFFIAEGAVPGARAENPDLETAQLRLLTRDLLQDALETSGDGDGIVTVHDALCAKLALAL